MIESALQGIAAVIDAEALLVMVAGVLIGILFGALPGITGTITLAILIPFSIKLSPIVALSLLLGSHVAVEFGGSISAILVNIPGTGQAVATCFDGYSFAKKGEAARAISIAAVSSAIGGIIGFIALVVSLPVMRAAVLALAAPEYFLLAFAGLSFIAILGGKSITKALLAGGLGLLLAMVGEDPVTSTNRFTFGWLYLWHGVELIPMVVGFFAFSEMVELMKKGTDVSISSTNIKPSFKQVWQGVKDCFIHWKTNVVCSVQGVIVGIIPGLGGTVANLMAYATAKQISNHPEKFGTGIPEGVIGPESANNSKEGGALIPTLAFGIPGSAAMAIFLGVFLMMGIVPGPTILTTDLHITFSLAWILALSNILAALIGLLIAGAFARFTFIPNRYLIPAIMSLGLMGAYVSANNIGAVIMAVLFCFLGYVFNRLKIPKAPLIVGLVLGQVVERYLHLAVRIYGPLFFLRPISITIIMLVVLLFVWQVFKNRAKRKGEAVNA